ncbi:DNA polymerase [Terrihabitans soli]|uniref:DNA polymerase n=1 Tax=Terrihabitans soli TaxID=708113 RepID=UPI001CA31026|nr:DNA polymerase [Terrihabitans soli]
MTITKTLVDARNIDQLAPQIIAAIAGASFSGLDVETHDDNRHDGLNTLCGYDPVTRKKSAGKKLVFDMRRTVMTGFSLYPDKHDQAYYINLNHEDTENRVSWEKAKQLLDALPADGYWIAHNAPYELVAFASCYLLPLPRIICTLQMATCAYGPDEYAKERFHNAGKGGIAALVPALLEKAHQFSPDKGEMGPELSELVQKIIAKESSAGHSYNGYVSDICYGYGLKKAVKSWFDYDMMTFEECLRGRAHMGQLTGAETVEYGADDAYWAVQLFHKLLGYMAQECPTTIDTFFNQENPMVQIFADIWKDGMKVNTDAIFERRAYERDQAAATLRRMKEIVLQLLPFDDEPHAKLAEYEKWYVKGFGRYRKLIEDWAMSPDSEDSFEQVYQVRGAVTNAWAEELGKPESNGPNLSHYMPMRVMLYDLLREKPLVSDGKIQSDGEFRGKLKDRIGKGLGADMIDCITELAGIEQRMKLYLTPYTLLMDPETGRLYPIVSSELATHRMAARDPNPMQLAKRGNSTYVRGFFEADEEDEVLVSIDWSAIELVIIGEQSGDPEFLKAYSQIPHEDLHLGAAADVLSAEVPELTEEIFRELKDTDKARSFLERYSDMQNVNRLFTNIKGETIEPEKALKYWRTEVGKGANFNYWYSGFLGTIGDRMGWSLDKTAEATDRYRTRFSVAEDWRTNLISQGQRDGYIILPDGHRRVRYEATYQWFDQFLAKFHIDQPAAKNYNAMWHWIARKIQKRANNQLVNAMVQGTCATVAKRSVIRIDKEIKNGGYKAKFKMPIHDELLYSVNRREVSSFINMARGIMLDHPDLFKNCKLDASPSVGLTFEPWHDHKAPIGQVELFELPNIGIGEVNGRANDNDVQDVVEYLFDQRKAA